MIDAFEALASAQGIEVIFTHTNYDPKRLHNCIRRMVERSVDAIAVMTSEVEEESLRQAVHAGVPVVLMNQRKLEGKYPNIPVEYAAGFREALEHLLSLGHSDIGFIAGPQTLNSAQAPQRSVYVRAQSAWHSRPHGVDCHWRHACGRRKDCDAEAALALAPAHGGCGVERSDGRRSAAGCAGSQDSCAERSVDYRL